MIIRTWDMVNDDLELRRAAQFLEADDIGDDRWAYYDHQMCRWYVVDKCELYSLCEYLDSDEGGYSLWCQDQPGRPMPSGWDPRDAESGN